LDQQYFAVKDFQDLLMEVQIYISANFSKLISDMDNVNNKELLKNNIRKYLLDKRFRAVNLTVKL
jgi:hypothetical protein